MTPEGWRERRVGDFCSRAKEINITGEDLEPLSVTKDRGVILQSEKYKKRIATDPKKYVVVRDGQFAFDPMSLYYGAIGRVQGIGRGLISPDYVAFEHDATVDPGYLNYLLRQPAMNRVYESLAETGNSFGKRRRLYWSVFTEIRLRLPPLGEQRRIAAILEGINELVATSTSIIANVERVRKAITVELLTTGMPGRHSRFRHTAAGDLPAAWDVRPVEELADVCTGDRDTQDKVENGAYPFVVRSDSVERINSFSFDGEAVLTAGDGAGTGKVFHYMKGRFDYHQRVYNIHSFLPSIIGKFFYFYFREYFIGRVRKFSAKNSVDSVRRAMITEMPVPVPPLEEQVEISDVLTSLDERLQVERDYLVGLLDLRSSLAAALLTGEVRVPPNGAPATLEDE
jgi:type I restriction enzyme S subunit